MQDALLIGRRNGLNVPISFQMGTRALLIRIFDVVAGGFIAVVDFVVVPAWLSCSSSLFAAAVLWWRLSGALLVVRSGLSGSRMELVSTRTVTTVPIRYPCWLLASERREKGATEVSEGSGKRFPTSSSMGWSEEVQCSLIRAVAMVELAVSIDLLERVEDDGDRLSMPMVEGL